MQPSLPLGGLCLKVWQQQPLIPPEPVSGSPDESVVQGCQILELE